VLSDLCHSACVVRVNSRLRWAGNTNRRKQMRNDTLRRSLGNRTHRRCWRIGLILAKYVGECELDYGSLLCLLAGKSGTEYLLNSWRNGSPLWSNGQSPWLQIQRSHVRFPALPDFLRSSWSGTGPTQPREDNWGATWKKSSGSGLENWN
jgi:hypothetical protein